MTPTQDRRRTSAERVAGYARAINQALAEEMRRDERVWMMGQDIGKMGGVFGVTRGLFDEFGAGRVRDTTINETFIVGAAAGAALTGTIPVVELQFADFGLIAGDEVFHKLAKWRYMHGGKLSLPVVCGCRPASSAAPAPNTRSAWRRWGCTSRA